MEPSRTRAELLPLRESLRLLVSLPALDEEATVASVIRGVPRPLPGVGSIEIVVIDDGSSDRTAERAIEAGARVIRHPAPRGVGAAFHSALAYGIESGADLIVSIDADGQFDPADIPALIGASAFIPRKVGRMICSMV